jgi:hypothetical protein
MAVARFVVIVLCGKATLDDLISEQKKHKVVAVEVLRYDKKLDYLEYRKKLSAGQKEDITIMFIFGNNDTVMVRNEADMNGVQERFLNEDFA